MSTLPQTIYQLRDYQQALVQQVFAQWHLSNRRVMLQSATGSGKTVVISAIAREFTGKGENVLLLVHRQELVTQSVEKLRLVTGKEVGIIKSGCPANSAALVQVASVQTLTRRKCMPEAALIVVDEAHHSCSRSYTRIFEHYQQSYVLGCTATPARLDGQGFKFLYDSLVVGSSVATLIEQGHLSRYKLFASPNAVNTKGVRTTGGDFNARDLATAVDSSLVAGDLIETWRQFANGKKTVVFAIDIAHSKAVADAYIAAGVPAEHLDGETPSDERVAILNRFRSGETLILTNCGIVSEGFDLPSIEAAQIVRPTKSVVLWLQMCGRALRPAPGKDFATIIDHTMNWFNLGLPDEPREWTLEPVSLQSGQWALECPDCSHVFKPLPHEQKPFGTKWDSNRRVMKLFMCANCPNCEVQIEFEQGTGNEPPPARIIEKDESATLQLIQTEANVEIVQQLHRLKQIQERRGFQAGWIYYKLIESYPNLGLLELREVAKTLGYKPSWALFKLKELEQQTQQSA